MFFQQVDLNTRKRISAEAKIDLKVASLTLREAEDPTPTRMAKLKVVELFIDRYHDVGTIENPGADFFYGQMPMTCEWVDPKQNSVWFQGNDYERNQCVMLGGSRHHVVGQYRTGRIDDEADYAGSSNTIHLMNIVGSLLLTRNKQIEAAAANGLIPTFTGLKMPWSSYSENSDYIINDLEFLAIPLAEQYVELAEGHVHVVVGTPLYVAHAHRKS